MQKVIDIRIGRNRCIDHFMLIKNNPDRFLRPAVLLININYICSDVQKFRLIQENYLYTYRLLILGLF